MDFLPRLQLFNNYNEILVVVDLLIKMPHYILTHKDINYEQVVPLYFDNIC